MKSPVQLLRGPGNFPRLHLPHQRREEGPDRWTGEENRGYPSPRSAPPRPSPLTMMAWTEQPGEVTEMMRREGAREEVITPRMRSHLAGERVIVREPPAERANPERGEEKMMTITGTEANL